jgi:DNA-binding transcriptional MerR regulator
MAADSTSGDSTPEPEDLVTVREAAQQAGVTIDRVHKWIHRGAVPASPGRHGQLVSVTAVCTQRDALAPPPDSAEYTLPSVAARQLGLRAAHVHYWVSRGTVASKPSRYGRLVRLADVQAVLGAVNALAPPPHPDDYVAPAVAARVARVPPSTVRYWATLGKVASQPGPNGRLVRLRDVQALTQARAPKRRSDAPSRGGE